MAGVGETLQIFQLGLVLEDLGAGGGGVPAPAAARMWAQPLHKVWDAPLLENPKARAGMT